MDSFEIVERSHPELAESEVGSPATNVDVCVALNLPLPCPLSSSFKLTFLSPVWTSFKDDPQRACSLPETVIYSQTGKRKRAAD